MEEMELKGKYKGENKGSEGAIADPRGSRVVEPVRPKRHLLAVVPSDLDPSHHYYKKKDIRLDAIDRVEIKARPHRYPT